ncbi:MAG: UDP-N-acetylglucosamine--N-acetylmuramyl-(pentapeptide) pyrophosphoryl-undecaprenol N-acetylglucosamine transferase, partial [Chloroflexota bacterium]|nr:UDP-N-acetylglucosamine--N-acetylmuramyl-(pentapeptide) pyrophosphoryl-undecaprenol N-acetylglucosamine transferase [Chloroflexota bacterium]
MSPLLAVADALREERPDVRFLFLGGRRGLEAELARSADLEFHATPLPSLRDPDSRIALLAHLALVPVASASALRRIVGFRPHVCVTSGGLGAVPVVLAARAAFVPIYLWEGNVVPGRVNRTLAGWSSRVGATFAGSLPLLPRGRTRVAGNPIRRSLLRWTKAGGRAALGLPPGGAVVLITGGSQGSERINDAAFVALPRLLRRAAVIHVTGHAYLARAEAKRAGLPEPERGRYVPRAFIRDEMGAALAAADLVVGRAGSSSIAEPLAFGAPMVLIPFGAAMNAHQEANARAVAELGAAVVMREGELDGDRLVAVVNG